MREEWNGFKAGHWVTDVNVRDFIQLNYTPYDGDASFLQGPTEATDELWDEVQGLQREERATVHDGTRIPHDLLHPNDDGHIRLAKTLVWQLLSLPLL